MKKLTTPGLINRISNRNNINVETTRLRLTENIELKLYYPKNKEYDVKKFINSKINDLYEVITDIPISNNSTVTIHINETGNVPIYNTKPYGGKSSRTASYLSTEEHDILISLDDVSGLVHEFGHVFDYDNLEKFKTSQNFKTMRRIIHNTMSEVDKNLKELEFNNITTDEVQLKYERSDNEIFARTLNQQYCRTHEPNIFADQLKPLMIDVVLDYLYNTDSEYKNAVDEFINEIPKINEWSNMKRVDILNYTYVDEDDIEVFIDTLNQITNENNQLNENTFR